MLDLKRCLGGLMLGIIVCALVGCEVGPDDKFFVTFTDSFAVQYNPHGTNETQTVEFKDDTTLLLKNKPELKVFAYAVGYQGPSSLPPMTSVGQETPVSSPAILAVAPGEYPKYFEDLLQAANPDGDPAKLKEQADQTVYDHANNSLYELDSPNGGISSQPINTNQPITIYGRFPRIQLRRADGTVIDYMKALNSYPPDNPQNQAVAATEGQPLTVEFKKVTAQTEIAGVYNLISNDCVNDGGPITISQDGQTLQFTNGFSYDCSCNYEGSITTDGLIEFTTRGGCTQCTIAGGIEGHDNTARCTGWVIGRNFNGVCKVTGTQPDVCTFEYERPANPPTFNR